jgi:hypothetical protein
MAPNAKETQARASDLRLKKRIAILQRVGMKVGKIYRTQQAKRFDS